MHSRACTVAPELESEYEADTDVDGHAESGPEGRNAGVVDEEMMDGVKESVADDAGGGEPEAAFEAEDGEENEDGSGGKFEAEGLTRGVHDGEQDIIERDDDEDDWVVGPVAVEADTGRENKEDQREGEAD